MNRKAFLALLVFVVAPAAIAGYLTLRPNPAAAREVIVHLDPNCGCCHGWITYLRRHGFTVTIKEEQDMGRIKDKLGVPADLQSCHTAEIGGYAVEGHVPLAALEKLLQERPDVAGIASPGMPSGSPGMDGPKEPNPIYAFGQGSPKLMGTY